ncbi:MAG: manganese efflux pump [Bacteroidales bacterium]|nr:manganese efflux pump [Bacteroidales bacterium]
MSWLEAIIIAVSLCADCFAVTLCSSVTIKKISWKNVAFVALSFAVIQASLLLAGWAFGKLLAPLVIKISHVLGFLLLLYVGGSMLLEGIRGGDEARDLNGLLNVFIGGVATSIDALAIGAADSLDGQTWNEFVPLLVSVFVVTALSAIAGICSGKVIGAKTGRLAEIVGGLVLIGIGVSIILR